MIPDTPGKPTRAASVQRLVTWVMETEYEHLRTGDRHDPVTTPFMPYQPADFLGIMFDVMAEIDGPVFLDVGCGPGTKMALAQGVFGLSAYGIEIDKAMADTATARFGTSSVIHGDAVTDEGALRLYYPYADVIWLYRPLRDREREARLEQLIIASMKPGAILAGGSWETDLGALGWQPVVDDCILSPDGTMQIWRGAWQKPKLAA